jgi:hypothetical protein
LGDTSPSFRAVVETTRVGDRSADADKRYDCDRARMEGRCGWNRRFDG